VWQLTVDLGASRTVASLAQDGAPAQIVQIDGASAVPSAVYLQQDGRLLVGLEAQRRAEHDPARYEPSPTLRIPETNLLLGEHLVPVVDAMAAVLGHIAGEIQQRLGAPPEQVLLSTPAYWGPAQAQALLQAATTVWGHGVQLLAGTQAAGITVQRTRRCRPDARLPYTTSAPAGWAARCWSPVRMASPHWRLRVHRVWVAMPPMRR